MAITALFTNVPVVVDGDYVDIEPEQVIERASLPPYMPFIECAGMIDAFALELMLTADEDPSKLDYRGVMLVEHDDERIVQVAGRNLLP